MGSEWPIVNLGEIIQIKYGKDHKKLNDGEVPCYGSGGIMRYVSEYLYDEESILIPRKGTLNNVFYIDEPFWTVDTLFWSIVDKNLADTKFIYYQLKLIDFNRLNEGSAVPSMTVPIINNIEIKLPAINIQKEVSKILTDLDNKITLNRQLNQTLEHMAQALFKSWFVDFDPVIDNALTAGKVIPDDLQDRAERRQLQLAKADHKPLPENIRKLFPSEFELTASLGWVPKGWGASRLDGILELAYGKSLSKTEREQGLVPVYGSGGVTGYHNQSIVNGPGIIVGRKGTVGSLYWEPQVFFPIDTVFYVKPFDGISLEYCFLLLQTLGLEDMNTDAAVPGLNRNNAYRLEFSLPDKNVLAQFTLIAKSFREKLDRNNFQINSLVLLRDTLLPKLISGELRIPEAEAQIEEAVA